MKQHKVSTDSDPGPRLQRLNEYLERNFPDFFAEARFQVGDDDYFLYARFGQYLARTIEQKRRPRAGLNRGFTGPKSGWQRAFAATPHPADAGLGTPRVPTRCGRGRGPLAPQAAVPAARGYLESLCE